MRRISRGFTIIELLVVVSVIGILATITLIGFNRYQADSRDSQRVAKATIISEALEKYYDKNGEYPSCGALTDTGTNVTSNVLVGTDPKALVAPQAAADLTNSISLCTALTTNYPTDSFAYVGDGSTTCSTGNSCLAYSLQYKEESTNTIKSITSRRTANILTSGNITDLAATTFSFSRIDLSWTGISGASSYNVQWKLNSNNFTTPTGTSTSTTASTSVTGLSLNSLYYFRVQPVSLTGSTGNWSNIASDTTYSLDTPICTAIPVPAQPASQLQCSWANVDNATSYTLDYANNSSFTTNLNTVTNATSPYVIGSLSAGTTRYFRVKSVASGLSSGWSATASATTQVPVPTGLAAVTDSSTQITASWNTVSVATSYTLDYSTDSAFTSPAPTSTLTSTSGSITGITGLNRAVTGLSQGDTFYFRVYALVGTTSSLASSSVSAITTVNNPTGVSVSSVVPGAVRAYSSGNWIQWNDSPSSGNWYYAYGTASGSCPSGTSRQMRHYANYNSPSTQLGPTGWSGTTTKYRVAPYNGYSIRFKVDMRCVGTDATSGIVTSTSGYAS